MRLPPIEPLWPPREHYSARRCKFCARPLTVHEVARRSVCARAECQRQLVLHDATEWTEIRYRRRQELAIQAFEATRPATARRAMTTVLPIPRLNSRPGPVTRTRRHRFAHRLIGLIRELASQAALAAPPERETASPAASDPAEVKLAAAACATCRGRCCQYGADHAFIDLEALQRQRRSDPHVTGRELLDRYLSHIPAAATQGSCLYHSASGCGLPRSLRSSTCEQYLCEDVRRVLSAATVPAPPRLWLAAINDGDSTPSRTRYFDPS